MREHVSSVMTPFRAHSCGKAFPKTYTKVEKENQNRVGSLCIWGRHIFMGYLKDKQSTERKVDIHGWLHTSDLGFLDFDKFLYIMGNSNGKKCTAYGPLHSLRKGMSGAVPHPGPYKPLGVAFQRQTTFFVASDLIKLSSGETVNPFPIEERVRTRIPIVRYAMLVGQDAPYLCALLTLKVPTEQDSSSTEGGWAGWESLSHRFSGFFFFLLSLT